MGVANLTETLYLAEVGPTDTELELKVIRDKRDEYWKEQLKCPNGFVEPHDSIVIPDPFLTLLKGNYNVGDIIERHNIQVGSYNTQGTDEPCYAYTASRVVRRIVPAADSYIYLQRRLNADVKHMLGEKADEIESMINRIPDVIGFYCFGTNNLRYYGTKLAILGFHMFSQNRANEFNQFCTEVAEKIEKDRTPHPGGDYFDEHCTDRSPEWIHSAASIKDARLLVDRKFSQEIRM